jgi:Transposase zinc-binding domain
VLAHGFARVRCESCKDEFLVAFSCKGRGVCPSCNAKRAHVTAVHLVEQVLPHVPYRQWTLSFPHRVRWVLLVVRSLPPTSSRAQEELNRMRARLREEARLATYLQHPRIARICGPTGAAMLHVCRRSLRNGMGQNGTTRDAAGYRLQIIPGGYAALPL